MNLDVLSGFLPNGGMDARRDALSSSFVDWARPDGEVYKRICIKEVPGLRLALGQLYFQRQIEILGMGYRLNFAGEAPNAAIHSDIGWGTHALVLYLSEGNSGTAFWKHLKTGAKHIEPGDVDLLREVEGDWNDESKWQRYLGIPMRMNRAVIYDSTLFHSRYPFEAFGDSPENGRLIAVCFFNMRD